jgi:hypothetical protein
MKMKTIIASLLIAASVSGEDLLFSFNGQVDGDHSFFTVGLNLHAIKDIMDRREYTMEQVCLDGDLAQLGDGVSDAPAVEAVPKGFWTKVSDVPKGFWTKVSEHFGRNKKPYGIGGLTALAVGIGYNTDWYGIDDDKGSRPVAQNDDPSFSIEAKGDVSANCISSANIRSGGKVAISNSSCGEGE